MTGCDGDDYLERMCLQGSEYYIVVGGDVGSKSLSCSVFHDMQIEYESRHFS